MFDIEITAAAETTDAERSNPWTTEMLSTDAGYDGHVGTMNTNLGDQLEYLRRGIENIQNRREKWSSLCGQRHTETKRDTSKVNQLNLIDFPRQNHTSFLGHDKILYD